MMPIPLLEWMALLVYFACIRHPSGCARQVGVCAAALPIFTAITFVFRHELPYNGWFPALPVVIFMTDFMLLYLGTGQRWKGCLYLATHAFMHAQTTIPFSYALLLSDMLRPVGHASMRPSITVLIGFVLCIIAVLVEGYAFHGTTLETISWRTIIISTSLSVAAVTVANLTTATSLDLFSRQDTSTFIGLRDALYLRTLTLLFIDSVMYGQQIMRHWHLARYENSNLQSTVRDQRQQYLTSQENLNEIHRLSHDMKHYLMLLDTGDASERAQLIDRLRESIDESSSMQQSGNPVLDTIIFNKQRECARQRIQLIVMADGTVLDHIDPLDTSSLVGNMLDNAIEASARLADANKRIIHFNMQRKRQFGVLHIDNHFDPTTLRHGPTGLLTSKTRHVRQHGHGLRSIKRTARKYGGTATETIDHGADLFNVDILLPLND